MFGEPTYSGNLSPKDHQDFKVPGLSSSSPEIGSAQEIAARQFACRPADIDEQGRLLFLLFRISFAGTGMGTRTWLARFRD